MSSRIAIIAAALTISAGIGGMAWAQGSVTVLDGVYTAAKLGATVGGGGDMTTMKNAKNVTIELNAITEGVKFTAGPGGVKLKLKQ